MSLLEKLIGMKFKEKEKPTNKISIVGVGEVGSATAYTILLKGLCNELALFDTNENRLNGELLDLKQGLAYQTNMKLIGSTDPSITQNSRIIIMTADCRLDEDTQSTVCFRKNVDIFKNLVPKLAKCSPKAVFLVVTNPVDAMTYITWKLCTFPFDRVIGIGTNPETQLLRYHISQRLGFALNNIDIWVIGGHGKNAVPLWSSAKIAGVNLNDLHPKFGKPDDPENWNECFSKASENVFEIKNKKGYAKWGSALSVTKLCEAIIHDERSIFCVSICAKHWPQNENYGINDHIFMSLPCVIGENGIVSILNLVLDDDETAELRKATQKLCGIQKEIIF